MREYIDAVNKLYSNTELTLSESLQGASDFEIDLIIESMDDESLMELKSKIMEFEDPSPNDVGLLTKIGAKIFGNQWASERQGALQAMNDRNKFMADWGKYSKRFNVPLTVENLKEFLKNEYQMGDKSFELASKKVKPTVDRRTKEVTNIDQFIPALSYAYFYGVGDQIEQRAEEKKIDIDALGYDQLPNNDTDVKPSANNAAAAQGVAGDAQAGDNGQAPTAPSNAKDGGALTGQQISTKMNKTLSGLHVSTDQRKQAMADAKKGFTQSFSKNSRTLAAIGYSYLKAIGA